MFTPLTNLPESIGVAFWAFLGMASEGLEELKRRTYEIPVHFILLGSIALLGVGFAIGSSGFFVTQGDMAAEDTRVQNSLASIEQRLDILDGRITAQNATIDAVKESGARIEQRLDDLQSVQPHHRSYYRDPSSFVDPTAREFASNQ